MPFHQLMVQLRVVYYYGSPATPVKSSIRVGIPPWGPPLGGDGDIEPLMVEMMEGGRVLRCVDWLGT